METIREDIQVLASLSAKFENTRWIDGLANDLFEACENWRNLGKILLDDKGYDIPGRVRQEIETYDDICHYYRDEIKNKSDCVKAMEAGARMIEAGRAYKPPVDGYLGSQKIVQRTFQFLESEFGFKPGPYQGMQWDYTSNAINVHLDLPTTFLSGCHINRLSIPSLAYSLEDLLFMGGRFVSLTLPQDEKIETEADVQAWFTTVANILQEYGTDVLADRPGAFDHLAQAAAERERLINEENDRLYGPGAPPEADGT